MVWDWGLDHSPTKQMTPWVTGGNKGLRTFKQVFIVEHFYNLHMLRVKGKIGNDESLW